MKIIFAFIAVGLMSSVSFAEEVEIKIMRCDVSNLLGYPIGSALMTNDLIHLKMGIVENFLWVNDITGGSVQSMTNTQAWNYIFAFSEDISTAVTHYEGTLYQQYALGFGGFPVPFAKISCDLEFN